MFIKRNKRLKRFIEQEDIVADIYIRSSKVRKGQKKVSPETQEQICRDYIKEMGWKVGIVRYDSNKSGWAIHYTKRPGLMDIFRRAENGENQRVVTYKFSRLGRKYQDEICDKFEDLGVPMMSATEKIDVTTSSGRVFRSNIGAMNRFFAEETSEWQQDTKQTNAENGKFNGGNSFYGANWDKEKKVFINNDKADIALKLFKLKLAGYGCTMCAKMLHDNYAHFGRTSIICSPKGNEWWQETTIQYLWQNPRYIGLIPHNGLCYGGEHIKEPIMLHGEWFNDWYDYLTKAHELTQEEALKQIEDAKFRRSIIPEPIIPIPLWNTVQEDLYKSSDKSSSLKASTHEFAGLITCSHDQKIFQYRKQDDLHPARWICSIKKLRGTNTCVSKKIDHDTFLNKILSHIFKIASDEEFWSTIKSDRVSLFRAENKPLAYERQSIEKNIAEIKETIRDLEADRYERKSISAEQFSRLNLKYQKELELLQQKRERVDTDKAIKRIYKDIDNLQGNIILLSKVWEELNDKERRMALSSVINQISVYDTHIVVDLVLYSFEIYPESIRRDVMFF